MTDQPNAGSSAPKDDGGSTWTPDAAVRTTALLLTADDHVFDGVATGLARDGAVRALRRARTVDAARAVVAGSDVVIVLADPRATDADVPEVADWLRSLDLPVLLLVPEAGAADCVPALGTDLPFHVVTPGAPWELLATAVHRVIEGHREHLALAGSYTDWRDRLAVVRHEMATPLGAIEGFLEALINYGENLPAARRRDSLEAAYRNAGRLRRLVAELNAVAKATGPAAETNLRMLELRPTLKRLVRDLGPRGDDVHVMVPADLWALVDSDHLEAVVGNLIDNAFKYGGTPIEVRARSREGLVQIAVIDHGEGVPDHFLPRMFERYTRAHEVRDRRRGSGIGLSLCAELADAMGGRLHYERGEDGGSVFVLDVLATRDVAHETDGPHEARPGAVPGGVQSADVVIDVAAAERENAAEAQRAAEPAAEAVEAVEAVGAQTEDAQSEDARTEDARTGDARTGDAQTGDAQSEDARTEDAQNVAAAEVEPEIVVSADEAAVEAETPGVAELERSAAEAEDASVDAADEVAASDSWSVPPVPVRIRDDLPAFDALAYGTTINEAVAAAVRDGGNDGSEERAMWRRPVAGELEVTRDGIHLHTTVGLGYEGRAVEGHASGAATAESSTRAIVRATLDAVESFLDGAAQFDVERIRIDGDDDDQHVTVTLTVISADGFERLVGAALTKADPHRAAMYATLDALNRRIERLLV